MTNPRKLISFGMLLVSLVMAFFLRDVVYSVFIVPLAYLLWLGKYYYSAVPQLLLWGLLLIVLLITVTWNFLPAFRTSRPKPMKPRPINGQIEGLAVWIYKARKGNYFKWQLANRLGKIARRSVESYDQHTGSVPGREAVEKYFDAGLNKSFVDFPSPRNRFQRAQQTPLDLDPKEAVDYIESLMELRRGRHP